MLIGFIVLAVLGGIFGAMEMSVLAGMAAQAAGIPFAIAALIEDPR